MTDRTNWAAPLMDYLHHGSAAPTGPVQPLNLRLMTAQGSNTSNGTQALTSNCPGYTTNGLTMGNPSFGSNASGVSSSANAVSYTATGAWTAVVAIETWDASGTPKRVDQGGITSVTLANANTLSFPAGQVQADGSQW